MVSRRGRPAFPHLDAAPPAPGALIAPPARRYGPDRKLFLPGGLLGRDEVPAYLNGTLPGE